MPLGNEIAAENKINGKYSVWASKGRLVCELWHDALAGTEKESAKRVRRAVSLARKTNKCRWDKSTKSQAIVAGKRPKTPQLSWLYIGG